jgi:hypothetical protein
MSALQSYQRQFTRHIRDPLHACRPKGVNARRMGVYTEIVFNNLAEVVSACFPVCRSILGVRRWNRLLRRFFIEHQCTSPLFRQIPEEFLRWLETTQEDAPPFLYSLAHYEWIEMALAFSDATCSEHFAEPVTGDMLGKRPVLAPALALLSYPFAVHRINKRRQPEHPDDQLTHIVVFRRADDVVKFIVLNPVSARLLALLSAGNLSGEQVLRQIAAEMQHPKPQVVIDGGLEIMEGLRAEGVIIGVQELTKKGEKNA